jgi:FkbM family methyltransferase
MNSIKQQIGKALFSICERFPGAKPWAKSLGLRTSKEWFAGRTATAQLPDGRSFKLASVGENYLSFELFWRGIGYYEPITAMLAGELVQPRDTFIDCGANIGFFSLVLSTKHRNLNVIAFEPNPKNFALLNANVRANNFMNVVCEPMALSDCDGTGTLYLSASDMSASLRRDFDEHSTGAVSVKITSLDNYLAHRQLAGRFLIKVDVEGHEAAFFRGAHKTLVTRQPDVIAEVALSYDAETTELLARAGYRFYQITNEGLEESPALKPVVRGNFVFLNYLISTKPKREIAALSDRLGAQTAKLDLQNTSKFRSDAAIREFLDLQKNARPEEPSNVEPLPLSDLNTEATATTVWQRTT